MYNKIIKPILFSLGIEHAHSAAILMLRVVGLIPGGRWLLRKIYSEKSPRIEKEVFGLHFRNPIGLAAGFDRNGEIYRELTSLGFGFVEIGTLTPEAQNGNPRPRIFRLPLDNALINRTGMPNRGLKTALRHLRRPHKGIIVGCNIGKNTATPREEAPGEYLRLFRNLYQYADYFTINLNCDNACREGATFTREYILSILNPLFDFRRGQNQFRPILLKVTPDLTDKMIDEVTNILTTTPLDGIVATNGTHERCKMNTSRANIKQIGNGFMSGAPLTERAIEIVRKIHTLSGGSYPIIGCGGLMTTDDVRRMMEAGADLVQVYTGFIFNGPKFPGDLCRALIADAEAEEHQEAVPQQEEPATENADTEPATPTAADPQA